MFDVTSVGQRPPPWPCDSAKVVIKFHPECMTWKLAVRHTTLPVQLARQYCWAASCEDMCSHYLRFKWCEEMSVSDMLHGASPEFWLTRTRQAICLELVSRLTVTLCTFGRLSAEVGAFLVGAAKIHWRDKRNCDMSRVLGACTKRHFTKISSSAVRP